jgi:ribosomal protein S10
MQLRAIPHRRSGAKWSQWEAEIHAFKLRRLARLSSSEAKVPKALMAILSEIEAMVVTRA